MKCPHCDYENGWSQEKAEHLEGNKGKFYKLSLPMTRRDDQLETLYACPNCSKTFINLGD